MKVLIIGSTATIGKAITDHLVNNGHYVQLAGRRQADIHIDLTAQDAIPVIDETFDTVILIAADFGGLSDQDMIRAEQINATGTLLACTIAHRVSAKHFILMSTISATYSFGDPHFGIYALSKRHSEEVAEFFCRERDIRLTILRPSQVYDDAGKARKHQAFLYLIADRAATAQNIEIFGSLDVYRNYLHIQDLAEIVLRIVKKRHQGIFNCVFPYQTKISEIASAAYQAFGTTGKIIYRTDKPDLTDIHSASGENLFELINFVPQINIEEGFRRMKYFQEHCQ